MIGNECINITKPEVSLEAYADRSNFKLYMGDTGLLVTQYMRSDEYSAGDLYKALIFNNLSIDQGMLFENIVAQMLRASGHQLYFHEFKHQEKDSAKEKKYEIDFLIVKKKKLCPIEVKSSNYKRHKSIDMLIEKYQLKAEDKYIIYTKNYVQEDNIHYIPLYMAWLL